MYAKNLDRKTISDNSLGAGDVATTRTALPFYFTDRYGSVLILLPSHKVTVWREARGKTERDVWKERVASDLSLRMTWIPVTCPLSLRFSRCR